MSPQKQESFNAACSYLTGAGGLGVIHCIDFTQWWHFLIAVLSTILILLQAFHDIPRNYKKFREWLKNK